MRTKKAKSISVLILSLVLVLTACGSKPAGSSTENKAEETTEDDSGSQASKTVFGTFESKTLDGEDVSQDIFSKADLTMVNIWGTFCGPCIKEMPELGELSRQYADKGVQIVGLISDVSDPGDETAEDIISTAKADYTHIVASNDLQNGILKEVYAVPTTYFVDKDGNQVARLIRAQGIWIAGPRLLMRCLPRYSHEQAQDNRNPHCAICRCGSIPLRRRCSRRSGYCVYESRKYLSGVCRNWLR